MPDFERGSVARPALSRCLSIPPATFGDDYWATRPLLTRAADLPGSFSDLFSADAVDELVSQRALRTPFARMAKEGSVLAPGRYTASGGYGAEVSDQLNSEKVLDEFADGSTLVLQGLHRTWAPLADFTRQLVADLGHPCQVNAYITPASARGFDPHYDVHDVFVIQIAGEKRWTIHAPVHPDPLGNQPWTDHRAAVEQQATQPAVLDETLRPGDVLYLPRGWLHSATALGGTSIHLTIGIAALTRYDIVEQLLERAAEQETLRQSLPFGIDISDQAGLRSIIEGTIADLTTNLRADDRIVPLVSDRLGRRLRDAVRPEPVRPLATVEAVANLRESTRVAWRGGLAAKISRSESTASVSLATKTITLPAECGEALAQLCSGEIFRAGALPGLDSASSLVVARRLLREGILVVR